VVDLQPEGGAQTLHPDLKLAMAVLALAMAVIAVHTMIVVETNAMTSKNLKVDELLLPTIGGATLMSLEKEEEE